LLEVLDHLLAAVSQLIGKVLSLPLRLGAGTACMSALGRVGRRRLREVLRQIVLIAAREDGHPSVIDVIGLGRAAVVIPLERGFFVQP
jgi:hypothetical protein